ncbi:MAG: septation protein IspZ [Comamonadaceae bacterium]|nr:septation protein IspZ [Comamonadaceae bacterium]
MLWVSLVLVVVLGGADDLVPRARPSSSGSPRVLYWAMGLALLARRRCWSARTCCACCSASSCTLPDQGLAPAELRLGRVLRRDGRCSTCGWPTASRTDTWVNFKLFGGIGLMLAFTRRRRACT